MARSIAVIKNQILLEKQAQTALSGLTSTSKVALFNLWAYITAVGINLMEQLQDIKKASIEDTVAKGIVHNDLWLQQRILEFQYDATTPQIPAFINGAVTYNPVDPSKRVISRCSVVTNGQRIVEVKVATGEPPAQLPGPQLSALVGYLTQGGDGTPHGHGTGIGAAGVRFSVKSLVADKLFMKATIKYNGLYSAIIQTNVITAINAYLASILFNGSIKVIDLVDAIQSVAGVTDILIEDLAIRADATAFANKTYLIQSFTQAYTTYPTFAGYVVEEDTSGQTFADQLTFVGT